MKTMIKIFALLAATIVATSGYAGASAPFRLDTRTGTRESKGTETLTYSSLWNGDASATVTIAQDGVAFAEGLTGEGERMWSVQKAGTYTLTHTTITNGVVGKVETATFKLTKDIASLTVGDIVEVTYNGSAFTPNPVVTDDAIGYTLVKDTDYTLAYANNVNAGTATVTVMGKGNYTGSASRTFTIARRDIAEATITLGSALTYNGKEQTQAISNVKVEGLNVTYTASDNKATDPGTYTLTVAGTGNFTGTATKQFSIARKSIAGATVTLDGSLTYTGSQQNQNVSSVVIDGLNATFDVSDNSVTAAGSYTVTVTGTGNFTGSATKQFDVAPKQITAAMVGAVGNVSYTGSAFTPEPTVTDAARGVTLSKSTDYMLSYANNVNAGTATVTVTGKGNYTGSIPKNFTIAKQIVTPPTIASKGYTGGQQVATVASSSLYDIVQNAGGVDVGQYDVKLRLVTPSNYTWPDVTATDLMLKFAITKAENSWITQPSIAGWTYGQAASVPDMGSAKFGSVSVAYSATPQNAGNYTATFTVAGTANYSGLSKPVQFTIAKATYNMGNARWDYSGAFTYDGSVKTVSVSGLPLGVTVASYDNNAQTAAGDYTAHAMLTYDTTNYNAPSIADCNWTIAKKSIAGATVTLGPTPVYTGSPLTQTVTGVKVDGLDATYTVSGNTGTDAGTYTLTVTGTGNFTGTATAPWRIQSDGIQEQVVPYDGIYDGEGHGIVVNVTKPAGVSVKYAYTEQGPYSEEAILFTNVTETAVTVWYTVEAANYTTVTNSGTVKITPKTLTATMVTVEDVAYTYDGTEKEPSVNVADGEPSILTVDDYEVVYSGNVNAGEGTVTVTGKGNYTGSVTKHFNISQAEVTAPGAVASKAYTGGLLKAGLTGTARYTVTDNGGVDVGNYPVILTLADATNYRWAGGDSNPLNLTFAITKADNEWIAQPSISGWIYGQASSVPNMGSAKFGTATVSYSATPQNAGNYTATFTVAETANYSGLSLPVGFAISKASYDMSGARWSASSFTYDGTEKSVVVEGLPYGVSVASYANSAKTTAGSYTATATLNYDTVNYNAPSVPDCSWSIARKSIAGATVTLGPTLVYNGAEQTQTVTGVKVDGLDATYTVSGNAGTEAEEYTLTVTGTGNFTGSTTKQWRIWPDGIVQQVAPHDGIYDGEGHGIVVEVTKPAGAVVKYAYAEQGPYSECAILFTNVTETAITVWYTVEAANYATVTNSGTVKITPKTLTDAMVSVEDMTYTYDGTAKEPAVAVADGEPSILTADDYEVAYSGNVDAGEARVTVTAKGNYTGAVTKHFDIDKAEVTASASIASKTYTGGLLKADVSATARYTVANDGGVDAGNYPVTLTLTDAANYRWAGGDSNPLTLTFSITKAENAWITEPSIAGWTYGQAASVPDMGSAKFGSVSVVYSATPQNAGSYTATFSVAETANYAGLSKQIPFSIDKAEVTAPASIASKTYTGGLLKADVSATARYTVANDGGVNAGNYPVTLTLTDAANYRWAGGDSNPLTLTFSIMKAENAWITEPSIADWTYGQAASEPDMGEAKFGTATVTYGAMGASRPTEPGNYVATFSVAETDSYTDLTKEVPFTILSAMSVSNVTARQRYPWNGLVDITCRVSGIAETSKGLKFAVAVVDSESGKARNVHNFWVVHNGTNSADRAVRANGDYRLLWDARAELGQVICSNVVVRIILGTYNKLDTRNKVLLWDGGPYWADTNVGAEKPEDYGYYFWWGDTVGYKREDDKWVASDGSSRDFSFSEADAATDGKDDATLQSEGWITLDGVLAPEHDAAHVQWGGEWRMPTDQELQDLNDKCEWTWTKINSVNGYLVRGKGDYIGASIFLPAGGGADPYCGVYKPGERGYYWSSVPCEDGDSYNAKRLDFGLNIFSSGDEHYMHSEGRHYGHFVRPVKEGTEEVAEPLAEMDSSPFPLDTRIGVRESEGVETLAYSSLWAGGTDATVTIAQDGVTLAEGLTGDGELTWSVAHNGTYVLTHTTYANGVAGKVETCTFLVTGTEGVQLEEIFEDLPVMIEPEDGGGWKVTVTNDIDSSDLPLEIPDNLGHVTIDLGGHDLVGADGEDGGRGATALPGGDGKPAIRIVPGEGDGEPTVLTVITTGGDTTVKGGDGGAGNPGGNGAPAIEVANDAQDGVLINIGAGVTVQGGDGGCSETGRGGDGGAGIVGNVGTNDGTIVGGNGGGSSTGDGGNGGVGVDGDVGENNGSISGGEGGASEDGDDGNPGDGVTGDVGTNNGTIVMPVRVDFTLKAGEYFKATLSDLGYDVPTNGTPYSVTAKGLPAGLKLKYNAAKTKKVKKGKKVTTVVVKKAKCEWWIEGVPTAAMDFFTNPPYLVITTNGVAETYTLPVEVLTQKVTELPDLDLGQSVNTNGWLAGVGAGWTVSGLPKGLKYATKKVTKKSGKKTVTVAEAYAVYGKTTKAGLFTITAKKKVSGFYETMKYRVLVRPKAPDVAVFGDIPTNITTMAYVLVAWDLANGGVWDGGHAGRVTLPSVGKVAKVTGLPKGLVLAGQVISGTPTKPGTYVVTFTKKVTTGTGKKKKTVAKTAQILWKVVANDAKVELGFNKVGGVIESGVVGLKYGDLLAFTATSNATVTASGLPKGMKLVRLEGEGHAGRVTLPGYAWWGFEGFTAKAGTYLVTVTATVNGRSVTQRLALVVEGLPDWAKGTFNGIVSRTGCQPVQGGEVNAQAARSTNGLATVTVSAAGKISGKFQELGTNWTFSAACYTGTRDACPYQGGEASLPGGAQLVAPETTDAFICTNVVAKYAYKVTEKVKGKKKTVTKYVTRTFTLTVEEAGTRDACPYRGVATMTEVGGRGATALPDGDDGTGTVIEAWQNLWGRADYKAVGKKLFYTSKKVPYRTFKVEVYKDGAGEVRIPKGEDEKTGLTYFLTLSLKVTPTGAVTATMSYDTGKTKKDKKTKKTVKVIYKATCSTVVLPLVAADVEPFTCGAWVWFAPSSGNGFDGFVGWVQLQ